MSDTNSYTDFDTDTNSNTNDSTFTYNNTKVGDGTHTITRGCAKRWRSWGCATR